MTKATGSFAVSSWDEETYLDLEEGKLTRASVTQEFTGDIEGAGAVEWLMSYRADGTAHFVGLQRIDAAIGDRHGTVVLETAGEFDGEVAEGTWSVVAGHADLHDLRGEGRFVAPMGDQPRFELEYQLG